MKKIALLTALSIALFAASTAQAAPFTPRMEYAVGLAEQYWGGPPAECTSIDYEIVPAYSLVETAYGPAGGQATQPEAGHPEPCVMWIDRRLAKVRNGMAMCQVIVHEDGHLHGQPHNDIPGAIMNPTDEDVPGVCQSHWRILINKHF